jgi:plasmid stabilization system protein ParE
MAVVRRSPLAEQDFREIWRHIAQDNVLHGMRRLRSLLREKHPPEGEAG